MIICDNLHPVLFTSFEQMHGSNLMASFPSVCLFLKVYCPSLTPLYLKTEVDPSSECCLSICEILNTFRDALKLLFHSYFTKWVHLWLKELVISERTLQMEKRTSCKVQEAFSPQTCYLFLIPLLNGKLSTIFMSYVPVIIRVSAARNQLKACNYVQNSHQ